MSTSQGHRSYFLPALLASACLLALWAPNASAGKVISEPGKGAGQARGPEGLAVDFETGRLYVADTQNNRVDVFDKEGNFLKAFGWGVKDGEAKLESCTTSCQEGKAGSGAGQLNGPIRIAVDNDPASASHHDVYVFNREDSRIEKFSPEGAFELAFGAQGEAEGQFSRVGGIGVGPGGTLYVVDNLKTGEEFKHRLQKFTSAGVEISPQGILRTTKRSAISIAVAPSGEFYVTSEIEISEYGPNGELIQEVPLPFEEENQPIIALGTSAGGDLFAVSGGPVSGQSVMERDSSLNRLRRFGYGSFVAGSAGVVGESGAEGVFVSEFLRPFPPLAGRILNIDLPPAGPLFFPEACKPNPNGNTKATLAAEVVPEGKASSYHVEYVTDATYQADVTELGPGHGFDHATRLPESAGEDPVLPGDFKRHQVGIDATLAPETKYRCRVIAANADGTTTGEEGAFTSLEPLQFGSTLPSGVGTEAATLNTEVNPLGIGTTGYFEYVDEATYQKDIEELGEGHGFDHATKTPDTGKGEEPIDFGAGESLKAVHVDISGLSPGTAYRFRIRAFDPFLPDGRPGPTGALRTYRPGEGSLPDNRAYELVSPAQKNSAEVAVPGVPGGLFNTERSARINAASDSGEALTYTSWTSFGEAEGAPSTSQYLSKRTPGGWSAENISPYGFLKAPLESPYRGFTADLGFGAFTVDQPALTPEAQEGFENLYLRDNETGKVQALTIEEPQLVNEGFCTGYAGSAADGSRAFFAAHGSMAGTGALPGSGYNLYEWSGEGLALVSVLPDGTPAPPVKLPVENIGKGNGFGGVGGNCTMDQGPIRNAISADGQTVFWRFGGEYKGAKEPLFARIDGNETIQLDAKPATSPGPGPYGGGKFWAASADGAHAFFTAPGKLTKDAKAAGQLYRYDTVTRTLTDLTPGSVAPEIEGVIGASEDGSYAYFVAKGALAGAAVSGADNLYVWHEGEGLRLIGALSELDGGDWQTAPEKLSARLTPDGRHLAFVSVETQALSGYDNRISPGSACQPTFENRLIGDPHCPEAYLYGAEADSLVCVSCNPAGSRPTGPAELPSWTNPYEGPRYLSEDGNRLFFESRDVLSAADENSSRDVYEYEASGSGGCGAASPGFDVSSSGCLSLISSGKSTDESYFVDASSEGRDAFLSTREALSGWDTNENYDVYDAREGGGFPEPVESRPPCAGEACKPPPAAPPASVPSPATPTFQGPGNPKPKAHKQKKHSKKHHRKGKAKKHRRAAHKRGASR